MIRFIVAERGFDAVTGLSTLDMRTFDFDVPALEKILRGGGRGPGGYQRFDLIGVEVRDAETQTAKSDAAVNALRDAADDLADTPLASVDDCEWVRSDAIGRLRARADAIKKGEA